jgi:hypothetical protein
MRCGTCPVASDSPCAWEGIPSLCSLAATSPRYRALVARLRPAPATMPTPEELAAARKSAKPRIPLGTKWEPPEG